MKRRTRKALVLVAGAAALAAFPVAGTLTYSYYATLQRSQARIEEVAREVAWRTSQALLSVEAALAGVIYDARNGCTPELIRELRNSAALVPALQGMGYITATDELVCTSYGMVRPPLKVGEQKLIRPHGSLLSFTAPMRGSYIPGEHIGALYRLKNGDWLFAAFSPEVLVDVVAPDVLGDDAWVRVSIGNVVLAQQGKLLPVGTPIIGAHREVGVYEAQVTVTASRAWALAPWRRNVLITGGIGASAGLALAWGAAWLGRKRLSLVGELRDGLENHEFEVWYQPVIDLQRARCAGAEALIRWRHPERDLVPPDLFIALAEESGVIIPMTRWLMDEVGRAMATLLREHPHFHLGINLAPSHFQSLEVISDAQAIIEAHGINPHQILFEITERGLLDSPECHRVVEELSSLGAEVAIDDFGTGYSSLAYLESFKLDYLKIDKTFVSAIGRDAPAAKLTEIIIEMARSLGLKTIAEGVETEAQAQYLRAQGVHYAQGWLFSKPLTAADFLGYVEEEDRRRAAG